MNNFEIKCCQGLGPVEFGMTPSQVKEVLGAKQHYENWMGGNLNDSLLYTGLLLRFDERNSSGPLDNSQLIEIEINPETFQFQLLLFGKHISDWKKCEFLAHLIGKKIEPPKHLKGVGVEGYYWEELHLEVDFDEQGIINHINFW